MQCSMLLLKQTKNLIVTMTKLFKLIFFYISKLYNFKFKTSILLNICAGSFSIQLSNQNTLITQIFFRYERIYVTMLKK